MMGGREERLLLPVNAGNRWCRARDTLGMQVPADVCHTNCTSLLTNTCCSSRTTDKEPTWLQQKHNNAVLWESKAWWLESSPSKSYLPHEAKSRQGGRWFLFFAELKSGSLTSIPSPLGQSLRTVVLLQSFLKTNDSRTISTCNLASNSCPNNKQSWKRYWELLKIRFFPYHIQGHTKYSLTVCSHADASPAPFHETWLNIIKGCSQVHLK